MKRVASISGGRTSAYLAANYHWDDYVFALVRTDDKNLFYKDDFLRKYVENKIQKEFIGTNEDDVIIRTMYELEQFLGKNITWVTGMTFDEVINKKKGWLPGRLNRYCTSFLKLKPIEEWWYNNHTEPIEVGIGFRANEDYRVKRVLEKCNTDGYLEGKIIVGKRRDGSNKWKNFAWEKPVFPLYDDRIYADEIHNYWADKPVTFADYNNCVHCFHRNAYFLRSMAELHPEKMQWAANKEGDKTGYWRTDVSYKKIMEMPIQQNLFQALDSQCDDGFCELS